MTAIGGAPGGSVNGLREAVIAAVAFPVLSFQFAQRGDWGGAVALLICALFGSFWVVRGFRIQAREISEAREVAAGSEAPARIGDGPPSTGCGQG